jgi:hypothetical protein
MAWSGAGVGLVALIAVYVGVFRPRQLRWGATDEEVAREMPGDEIVPTIVPIAYIAWSLWLIALGVFLLL